ncbi:MAG TPA: hypothetical protein VFN63_09370 [Pseudolabrys sp.]|nr:hypothetical protein [Pseudolabrys sp.]
MDRFVDIDRQRWRRLDREEAVKVCVEVAVAKRRAERRQHGKSRSFTEFMVADERRRAPPPEQHDLPAIALSPQRLHDRAHLQTAIERTEHDQIRPEVAQHGPHVGRHGLARNEAKLIEHFGKKCPHMHIVFENAAAWRNWPAAERNDLSHSQYAAIVGHGCVPPQNWPCGKLQPA